MQYIRSFLKPYNSFVWNLKFIHWNKWHFWIVIELFNFKCRWGPSVWNIFKFHSRINEFVLFYYDSTTAHSEMCFNAKLSSSLAEMLKTTDSGEQSCHSQACVKSAYSTAAHTHLWQNRQSLFMVTALTGHTYTHTHISPDNQVSALKHAWAEISRKLPWYVDIKTVEFWLCCLATACILAN